MKDWNDTDVSPYLQKPLRSYAEALADLRRRKEAIQAPGENGKKGKLIPFPLWRRQTWIPRIAGRRGLKHPA